MIPIKTIETDENYADIWLRFDTHRFHIEHSKDMHNEYESWLYAEDNRYDIWGGDMCEFAIPSHGKGKYEVTQTASADVQFAWLKKELEILPDKHIAYVLGNHEIGRMINPHPLLFHEDQFEKICKKSDVIYSRVNTFVLLQINEIKYLLYLSHGGSSAQRPGYPLDQLIKRGISGNADIVMVGHTHHNHDEEYKMNYVDTNTYELSIKKVLGIRPGSFLVNPEYTGTDRPRPEVEGNVILRLSSVEKRWKAFENLEDWKFKW